MEVPIMAKIQKMIAVALLMMFVISMVPLVAAERNDDKAAKKEVRVENKVKAENSAEKREVRSEERVRSVNSDSEDDDASEATTSKNKERVQKVRQNLEEVKAQYKEAKERYSQAKELYETEKAKFKETKEKAKRCLSDSEDCKVKKTELKKGVAQHLLKTNDLIARSLEKLTDRVQNSNALTEEQKAEALASIEELETTLAAEKDRVNALAVNATNAELREAIQNLKHVWQDVRKEQRKIVSLLISAKLENMSEKLAQYSTSMQQSIDQLKAAGKDTTELEALYADFAGKVEALKTAPATEAATLLQEAKELLRQFKSAEEELKESESAAENETEEETAENESEEDMDEIPENESETEDDTDEINETETGEDLNETESGDDEDESVDNSTEVNENVTETNTGATAEE